jgi:hypothetical protein
MGLVADTSRRRIVGTKQRQQVFCIGLLREIYTQMSRPRKRLFPRRHDRRLMHPNRVLGPPKNNQLFQPKLGTYIYRELKYQSCYRKIQILEYFAFSSNELHRSQLYNPFYPVIICSRLNRFYQIFLSVRLPHCFRIRGLYFNYYNFMLCKFVTF